MLFLLLLKTVSEFWKCCLPPSNRGQCRWWVQPSLSVTQGADELSWDTWINRQINLYSGVCSMSSLSLSFLSLSLSVYTPVSFPAKTHINHWSMQLIFPPTCQEKEWERHRPHPGSVYLCYYRRVNCEAFLFSSVFTEITMHSAERDWEWRCLPWRETEALERERKKNSCRRSPFNVFEALEIDERYVIDFASCGLLFLCADNYERISQSKQ